ncbi:thioesterase II family protein [Cesiribacter sp. SM1]|uniref:thioesterase II family protein n=1 Tax=Cesiribacter sp. SM1 TaxID=2861196 RepID=UPI001CD215A6|nr:thioesterase domain-containing protein [Cesiribacter sp. SM1]
MESVEKKVKIFAIPFAGGSKYSYRVLHDYVPSHFSWETIELPGRGARIHENLLMDINKTADDVFNQIRHRINGQDYIIYGHSMGTLLGYELTKRILQAGLNPPVSLFFTGRGAPGVREEIKISGFGREAFWKEIKDLGGLPEEILQNEEMKDFFEPFLRADFKAVEDYEYQPMEKPFPIPLFVRIGSDELVYWKDALKWQNETQYELNLKALPGDHFFIFQYPEYIIMQIVESYTIAKELNSKVLEIDDVQTI